MRSLYKFSYTISSSSNYYFFNFFNPYSTIFIKNKDDYNKYDFKLFYTVNWHFNILLSNDLVGKKLNFSVDYYNFFFKKKIKL